MNEIEFIWMDEILPSMPVACMKRKGKKMATRKWIAADGTQHDSAGAADEHDAVQVFAEGLVAAELASDMAHGANLYYYFSANFRVPKERAPRTPKAPAHEVKTDAKHEGKKHK